MIGTAYVSSKLLQCPHLDSTSFPIEKTVKTQHEPDTFPPRIKSKLPFQLQKKIRPRHTQLHHHHHHLIPAYTQNTLISILTRPWPRPWLVRYDSACLYLYRYASLSRTRDARLRRQITDSSWHACHLSAARKCQWRVSFYKRRERLPLSQCACTCKDLRWLAQDVGVKSSELYFRGIVSCDCASRTNIYICRRVYILAEVEWKKLSVQKMRLEMSRQLVLGFMYLWEEVEYRLWVRAN